MALHDLEIKLAAAWPPAAWQDVTVLLAVSGGGDSVALLRAMAALKRLGDSQTPGPAGAAKGDSPIFVASCHRNTDSPPAAAGRLVVAHVNHQLRGAESDADEAFVVDLCRRLGIECEVGRASGEWRVASGEQGAASAEQGAESGERGAARCDGRSGHSPLATRHSPPTTPNPQSPIPNPQSAEAAARHARYALLEEAAGRLGARYVVTAHTADDQAETILHRILRGTGIRGLAGMRRSRPLGPATLLRPLLAVRRAELAAYLQQLGQTSRRDSSNRSLRFTRNRIRHRLFPLLAERFNPGVVEALLRLGALAGQSQTIIDRLVEDLAERSLRPGGPDTLRLVRQKLEGQPKYLLGELLSALWRRQGWPVQAMGHDKWELLTAMLCSAGQDRQTPRKVLFPGAVTVEIAGDEFAQPARRHPARSGIGPLVKWLALRV